MQELTPDHQCLPRRPVSKETYYSGKRDLLPVSSPRPTSLPISLSQDPPGLGGYRGRRLPIREGFFPTRSNSSRYHAHQCGCSRASASPAFPCRAGLRARQGGCRCPRPNSPCYANTHIHIDMIRHSHTHDRDASTYTHTHTHTQIGMNRHTHAHTHTHSHTHTHTHTHTTHTCTPRCHRPSTVHTCGCCVGPEGAQSGNGTVLNQQWHSSQSAVLNQQ